MFDHKNSLGGFGVNNYVISTSSFSNSLRGNADFHDSHAQCKSLQKRDKF